jgi:methyl-accepting chemotaxis protein
VADEVRKLAERSGRETKAIAQLIDRVQVGTSQAVRAIQDGATRVEQGTNTAEQAGHALDEILAAVRATVEQVNGIAASAQQLDAASRVVTTAMESISAVAEESTAATEEMAAQGSEVSAGIESIAEIARTQSVTTATVSTSAQQMSMHVDVISTGVHELRQTATHLHTLVAPFKLNSSEPAADVVELRRAA